MSILLADLDATCAALGYSDGKRYQAEPDAIQSLKHLIWILRRDLENHEYRRHLGRAKVLQTDLVYMLPDYIQEDEYADVLIRLLVILTNPTLLLYREGPPKDNHGRKVFLELIDILQGYKCAFTCDKVWSALFGKLQKALEIDWALRSEEQSLLIERVLVLIRNVLQVPANQEVEGRADNDASVHDQVIWALHQSGILDLILFVISSPDEHQFHLHGLEILCLLYREQTAESLADASLQRSASEKQRDEQELMTARQREKQRFIAKPPPGRHSRFGGTYVIRNMKSVSDRDIICHQPLERIIAIDFDQEKQQQKRSFRHVKEEAQVTRRSAFSVRLCLREYCIEVLRSAYNTLVRQVRRVLERNSGTNSHDDSYLLWAIRFFMEFSRLSGLQLHLVSESLSVQCFHWVLTRMQHDMDMIVSDKKQARLWSKRLHVALLTFRELLLSLLALQKLSDDKAQALFDMLLNNVCYVMEYRETLLHLLMNYNETHSTKAFLRDVVETANTFIKMMEKFCKDTVLVQDKKRQRKRLGNKDKKKVEKKSEETEEELSNKWAQLADEITNVLTNELKIPEEDQPLPFDATLEQSIDDQKEECMKRIHRMLRLEQLDQAAALLRSAREVWPENDLFGSISAAPEDEMLLLREIFMHNIATVEKSNDAAPENANETEEDEEFGDYEDDTTVEKAFKFNDFAKRLLNPKIVRACTIVLTDWTQIPTKSLKAAVTILHRIAYGCSCVAMLYQAKLFRIFQQVFNAPSHPHHEELRRLGVFVVRKFVEIAPTNPKIYAELLFYKNVKEANELENGYCDDYECGPKGTWTEEQENELLCLFEENQRNPENDMDVIDWILENLIDKTRTRRSILKKLKEMNLMFKAPTKRSTAAATNKNLWRLEEDEELQRLFDEHRLEENCLQSLIDEFEDRKNKQQIIKRMLQLHMIADKSEILPKKPRKRQGKKKRQQNSDEDDDDDIVHEYMEEPMFDGPSTSVKAAKTKLKAKKMPKTKKASQRKIVRTPLDVGTVRAFVNQLDIDKFQEAIDWLKECLEDAAEDTEEPLEENDGIPLLPLLEIQKEAMEDVNFQKLLVALGIQPPIEGMESYWRIPSYLNSSDIKLRSQIVAGEEIKIDDNIDHNDDNNESDTADVNSDGKADEESEDDFFDDYLNKQKKKPLVDDFLSKEREKMQNLLFNKSDEEDSDRVLLKTKRKRQRKQQKQQDTDLDDNEHAEANEIFDKLTNKKRHGIISSDDDDENYDISKIQVKVKTDMKNLKDGQKGKTKAMINGNLFDQLKTNETRKTKKLEVAPEGNNADSDGDDILNFNSEDYRKRLLELGDSSDEDDDENFGKCETNNQKNRARRPNVIDSDSDEEENEKIDQNITIIPNNSNNDTSDDRNSNGIAKISNRITATTIVESVHAMIDAGNAADATLKHTVNATKKRFRGSECDFEDDNNDRTTRGDAEDGDEDDLNGVDKSTNKALTEVEDPPKRRRVAVIDDDDD